MNVRGTGPLTRAFIIIAETIPPSEIQTFLEGLNHPSSAQNPIISYISTLTIDFLVLYSFTKNTTPAFQSVVFLSISIIETI